MAAALVAALVVACGSSKRAIDADGISGTSGGTASGGTGGGGVGGIITAGGTGGKGSGGSSGCTPDSTFCSGSQIRVCTAAGTDSTLSFDCINWDDEDDNDLLTSCRTCSRGTRCSATASFATVSLSGIDTFNGPIDGCEASGYAYRDFSVGAIDDGELQNGIDIGTTSIHFGVRHYESFPSGVQQTLESLDGAFTANQSRVQAVGPVTFTLTYGADSNVGSPIKIEASAKFTTDFVDTIDVTYVYDGVFTTVDEKL
jgi:hypothetical protein